jgi:uncharacterized membrane protein YphA (DoxX/SURF4 family)
MKILVTILRILVGLLFIFSGLVKANDPLGLSYKMQEYFEVWHTSQFDSHTLLLSVLMNAFEIIAGFALLLGWRTRLFMWLLLLLIVFFTFLTGYTFITGEPKNCGCFGDCLPITSKTSFLKDIVLTAMIGFLFWQQRHIRPLFSGKINTALMLLVTIFSFGFQWYALTYLPVVDCMPYKKGNNITEKMKMPVNAIPDSTVITFVYIKGGTVHDYPIDKVPKEASGKDFVFIKEYDKDLESGGTAKVAQYVQGGKTVEFTSDQFPPDFSASVYTFKSRYDKLARKGRNNEPPIKGFVLTGVSGTDSTEIVLQQPYAILLFLENFSVPVSKWDDDFGKIYAEARKKNIPVYTVTTNITETRKRFTGTVFADVPMFTCDFTAIRTAARTSPCFYILKKGTIEGKWSHKTMEGLGEMVQQIPAQPANTVTIEGQIRAADPMVTIEVIYGTGQWNLNKTLNWDRDNTNIVRAVIGHLGTLLSEVFLFMFSAKQPLP